MAQKVTAVVKVVLLSMLLVLPILPKIGDVQVTGQNLQPSGGQVSVLLLSELTRCLQICRH